MQAITFPKLNAEFFTYTAAFRELRDYSGCTRLRGTGVPPIITAAVISICLKTLLAGAAKISQPL